MVLRLLLLFVLLLPSAVATAASGAVTLQGRAFYLDGQPWLPKGVNVAAFVRPKFIPSAPKWMNDESNNPGRQWWGQAEFNAIRSVLGGSVIRFQISQAALDPRSPIHDPAYLVELTGAIKQARAAGFVVICSMSWGDSGGLQNMAGMPDDGTTRAWQALAPQFVHDPGIMFELFNEPKLGWTQPGSHQIWAQGMQTLIDEVRSLGAANILLLDGLGYAQWTNDLFPMVHDRLPDRMAMAVHPYLDPMRNEAHLNSADYWRRHFSASAAQVPMIATEWNATPKGGCAGPRTPELSLELMRLLASLHVGVIGWSIDTSAKLVKDHTAYEPTDYTSFKDCLDGSDSGGGRLLANFPNN
ncbi:cellulase family glycosylhydrolase [Nitrospirillum sp. BR 11752]|uniref:cellulase family glycosylhydrolase n=1 Tax=Nitrospirillum sp. BR 11752 TaxID=3104293 RepID=UPI002EABF729|nr:cellulase family glycosylhydrolase [Nitrospirillum sp. BR 11752]